MLEFTAFTYTLLASFVLSSATRNRRERRPHAARLVMAGWVLMSMSFALAAMLLGWAFVLLISG